MRTILFFISLFIFISCNTNTEINIPFSGKQGSFDSTYDVREMFQNVLNKSNRASLKKISFDSGRYDFYPDFANEKYMFVSNNDEGLKRVVFLWEEMENFEFDGNGSTFVFHGFTNPFILNGCKNITFRNFNIDWDRTFHSEGKILDVKKDYFDIHLSEEYPYKIVQGMLVFTGFPAETHPEGLPKIHTMLNVSGRETYPFRGLLEFDSEKRETAYLVRDYGISEIGTVPALDLGGRNVRVFRKDMDATVGNTIVFGACNRNVPAFTLSDCENIVFEDVNLYHCGGMGVIAQRCKDVELHRCKVTPSPGKDRIVSLTGDATHFVNCMGRIVLNDCIFENQMDDATNVHGIYVQIIDIKEGSDYNVIDVRLIHQQQFGFDFIKPGMELEFVDALSMNTYYKDKVRSVWRLNKEITRVELLTRLPENVKIGDAVCDASIAPELIISNCYIGKNRARGVLLNSRGKTLIEGNTFHTPGAAILLEGDARYWFEQAGVRDLQIRNNTFDNCNYGVWGSACIETLPGIDKSRRTDSRYNKNIIIEDNVFNIFDNRILNFYSTDGLVFRNNTVNTSSAYPLKNQDLPYFSIEDCDNVNIQVVERINK
jgi:hypothetical protein